MRPIGYIWPAPAVNEGDDDMICQEVANGIQLPNMQIFYEGGGDSDEDSSADVILGDTESVEDGGVEDDGV